ncbi:MAG: hypothetical protein WCJ84_04705 [Candidatus Peregrinibacteria bacterium]
MHPIDTEIQQLLAMVPYLDANERTGLLAKLPEMTEEKKITIRTELWQIIKQLIAKVPLEAFMESEFTDPEKEQILRIQEAYLHDLRHIEADMRTEFLAHEQDIQQKDEQIANNLLLSLA